MSSYYGILKVAFLDLDGTLTQQSENAGIKLEKTLYEKHLFPEENWMLTQEVIRKYRRNEISYEELVLNLSRIYAHGLRGVSVCEVQNVLPKVIRTIKFREDVPEVLEWLKANGFFLVLVSASPIEIVRLIASKLHFNAAYGLELEIKDGVYTGNFLNVVTSAYKRNVIKIVRKLNNCRFSIGIGDNWYDMEAYKDLDIRFLVDGECRNERFIDGKTIVIKNLKEMSKFLTLSPSKPILLKQCRTSLMICFRLLTT